MRTIADQWNSFASAAIPQDASDVQKQECRRSFYAGAHGMLCILKGMALANLSTAATEAILRGLENEGEAFVQSVLKGDA